MSIIPSPYIAIAFALVTIVYGVLVEKYYVSRYSIMFNCVNVIILAMTLDVSRVMIIILLGIYAIMGWILVKSEGHGTMKQLFGSKPHGSLSLALALDEFNGSIWFRQLLEFLEQTIPQLSFFESNIVLFSWVIIGIVSFAIQGIVLWKDVKLRL